MAFDTSIRNIRVGARVLLKERSFTALAVTVLALGICGVTTMFGVVNGVMLRGFGFPNDDRLASANLIDPTTVNPNGPAGQVSAMDYEDLKTTQQSFEHLAAYLNGSTVNVTIDGQPRRYVGAYVTEDFLKVLGVRPAMGRDFTAADNAVGAPGTALISHAVWQRDFGSDQNILGRVVSVNGKPSEIVGVMGAGFAFPTNEQLWVPLYSAFPPRPRTDQQGFGVALVGTLKTGVTSDHATAEFTSIARRFAEAYPESNKRFNAGLVQPLIVTFTPPQLRGTLLTMLAFCVGVLLIACVNVMNMQFARATLRAKELAIRSSLGGSRLRLVMQMLTESLLLAGAGALAGIGLAYLAIGRLTAAVRGLENPPPAWITFDVDGSVLGATVLATVLAALVSGILPALMASRTNTNAVLRDGGRGTTGRRAGLISRGLVVFQIVVTCVLLIGSLLQLRSILNQETLDFGYDTGGVLSARMGLMDGAYPTAESRQVFFARLEEQLTANSAYAASALTNRFRMVFSGNATIEIEGREYRNQSERTAANFEQVTPGFFNVTDQRLLDGRGFALDDADARQPVAVVNAAFAAKYFGREQAIGRRFRTSLPDGTQPGVWRTIVGVVSTVRMLGPFNNPGVDEAGYYVPFLAQPAGPVRAAAAPTLFATVVVKPREGQAAESLAPALARDVAKVDPDLPLYFVGTARAQIDSFIAQGRIIATMFWIFGLVAVVLAAVGIYGVMSFSVSQRTQEFGVRMALGADRSRILGMVMKQGGWQVAIGVTIGLALAWGLARMIGAGIQAILFGVTGTDVVTYAAVAALVITVSLFATWVPARRATRVPPVMALRSE
jgi:predicted permease